MSKDKVRTKTVRVQKQRLKAKLILEDGSEYTGWAFGKVRSAAGEVVFTTGMNGLVQTLTDPASHGQIFVSYPIIGNCGVPVSKKGEPAKDAQGLPLHFESDKIKTSALVISDLCETPSHYSCGLTLSAWLEKENIPGIFGVDTRALAVRLRQRGTMKGKILIEGKSDVTFSSSIISNPSYVTQTEVKTFTPDNSPEKIPTVALLDCGVKANVIRCLLARSVKVIRVPFNHNLEGIEYDGLLISSGPGDPKDCPQTIETIRKVYETNKPVFGIGLGCLLMALAAEAETEKLPFGHRSQNQPCIEEGTSRCYVTSQNHGYTVKTLPKDWQVTPTTAA